MDNSFESQTGWAEDHAKPTIPQYLNTYYWWAYVHPYAVKFWDRPWLVNLILLTNYARLRNAALTEFDTAPNYVLQIACVYGDLTPKLAAHITAQGGHLDVVDVLPIQLKNLERKLTDQTGVRLMAFDSTQLPLASATYDSVLLFFLLHEQPHHIRLQTISEALRITKPDGRIVIVDFSRPYWWNPFRYLWYLFLGVFEPFALDMWRHSIADFLPEEGLVKEETRFFGGLFRKTIVLR